MRIWVLALVLTGLAVTVAQAQPATGIEGAMNDVAAAITALVAAAVPLVAGILVAVIGLQAGRALVKRFMRA